MLAHQHHEQACEVSYLASTQAKEDQNPQEAVRHVNALDRAG